MSPTDSCHNNNISLCPSARFEGKGYCGNHNNRTGKRYKRTVYLSTVDVAECFGRWLEGHGPLAVLEYAVFARYENINEIYIIL